MATSTPTCRFFYCRTAISSGQSQINANHNAHLIIGRAGQLNQTPWSQVDLLTETPQDPLWQAWNNGQAPNNAQILIEDANVRVQAAIDGQGLILADLLMQAELDTGVLVRISNHHLTEVGYGIKANSLAGQKLVAWLQEQAST